jgi:alanyl-tRNA synthetase
MTERLYLTDPYLKTFRARVVEMRQLDGRPAAVLDRSAFYPEGGGQPGDRGRLGGTRVLDTQEREGVLLHLVEAPVGGELDAQIDWERRFDHMQQHHGQHLLSAAFERIQKAPTLSFHLGERTCTIDLDAPVGKLDLRKVEAACNESIWRNHPILARDFVGPERERLPLRKEAVKGNRVVVVEGVDASPCGGTHPRATGEVGSVAVLRAQKWGEGKARVEFVCGQRVVKLLLEANEAVQGVADALKCAPADVAQSAARTAQESQQRRKLADGLLIELARHEAESLGEGPVVVATVERGPAYARSIAQSLVAKGRTALIATVDEGRAHLCFGRPKGQGTPMNDLLKDALAILGGKGGGGPDFAQGSGDPARLAEALEGARKKLL